ncbi:MAG: signal peptidase I, partial [Armatimonadetes bacterium]|nr:signal peptidase I [Armatimonadota bacterium]
MARTKLSYVVIFCVVCTVLRLLLAPTIAKTPPHLRIGGFKAIKVANEFLDAVIYAGAFVFLVIRPFVLQTFYIPSGSMVPTLLVNDYIVANKAIYRYTEPKRGDIVVFRPPSLALRLANQEGDTDYVKRLIGVPGDIVEMKQNVVFINNTKFDDIYKHFSQSQDNGQNFSPVDPNTLGSHDIVDYKLIEENGKAIPIIRGPQLDAMDSAATLKNGEVIS